MQSAGVTGASNDAGEDKLQSDNDSDADQQQPERVQSDECEDEDEDYHRSAPFQAVAGLHHCHCLTAVYLHLHHCWHL